MPSTYTTNGGLELPGDGEQSGDWGDTVNVNMQILDAITNGQVTLTLNGTSSTLTTPNAPTLSDGQNALIILSTGTISGTHTITIDPNDAEKIYFVYNTTAHSVVFTQGSGGNVTVATGDSAIIYANGGGASAAVANLTDHFAMSSVKITGGSITGITDLAVADGGTGASSAATALSNLGGAPSASPTFTGQASFADGSAAAPSIAHTGDLNAGLFFPAADTVAVSTAGTERMRITDTGRVGIGTSSPDHKVHIVNAAGVDLTLTTDVGNALVKLHSLSAGSSILSLQSSAGLNQIIGGAGGTSNLSFSTASTERMRIDPTGVVGIGTSVPSGYSNTGKFTIQTGSSTDGIVATFANSGLTGAAIQLFQNGIASATIGMPAGAGGITFAPVGVTETMRIDFSGNVGIGTSSPAAKLDVAGTTNLGGSTTVPAGVTTTAVNDGTKSTGTYTPTPVGGNMKYISNAGAFTLAAPSASGDYTMVIQITNAASGAGAITLTGFTRTVGDALTTTANSKFLVNITKINSLILASVVALQ